MVITTMDKWGDANALRIPQALCDMTGIHAGDKVDITAEPGQLTIRPAEAKWTLKSRMKEWDGIRFETHEYVWGNSARDEVQ